MSVRWRYCRSRRRCPTRISRPRRLWWSCLSSLRCSVRSLMRCVSIATWTSGEPVSPSRVAYSDMIFCLVAASSATMLLLLVARRSGACLTRALWIRGRSDGLHRLPARARPDRIVRPPDLRSLDVRRPAVVVKAGRGRGLRDAEHVAGSGHIVGHLSDERVDTFEAQRRAQPLDELEHHALAVEVEV